jgi:hypothetical protein
VAVGVLPGAVSTGVDSSTRQGGLAVGSKDASAAGGPTRERQGV